MKSRNILRDFILYLCIFIFPFMTIKALLFKWSIWLQKMEKEQKKYYKKLDILEGIHEE